jgi:hypothetical protein
MEKSEIRPFPPPEAVETNKGSNRPCSFAGPLRCSLVIIQVGTTRRGVQGGIVLNLHGRLGEASLPEQLRSLVADRGRYAPRSRLAGRQNPGGILLPLFISTA